MFKKYITLIMFVSLFCISSEINAQPGGVPGDCGDDPTPGIGCPPSGPIGGGAGIAILLAAGVAFGIKKLRD